MFGWTGNILRVDLSNSKIWLEETAPYTPLFIGGKGINIKIMFDEVGPETGPFDPENRICIGPGVLTGSMAPSHSRMKITSISPNGRLQNSSIGGHMPAFIRKAGYDNIVIQGKSDRLVYLYINDDVVEIRDAAHLKGLDTQQTQSVLKDELGDGFSVFCIGPAGEKLVPFGCVVSGIGHAAGRGGFGAIMGGKNLKALAVRGSRNLKVAKPDEFIQAAKDMFHWLNNYGGSLTSQSKGNEGCRYILEVVQKGGFLPLGNWESEDASWEQAGGEYPDPEPFYDECAILQYGCFGCPVHHFHLFDIKGRCKGASKCVQWDAFSSRVWNNRREVMVHANSLCQEYGLDSIGTGGSISFLMELYHKGIISEKDTDGVPMLRGDETAILTAVEKIGRQEGFGKLFRHGLKGAAKEIGRGAEECAMLVDGQDIEPAEMRACKSWGLAAATTDGTVAYGHVIEELGWIYEQEELEKTGKELFGSKNVFKPNSYEGKAMAVWDEENLNTVGDLTGTCKWVIPWSAGRSFDVPANLLTLATGRKITSEDLLHASKRTLTLERASKVRSGKRRDFLPKRFYETAVADGIYKGERLDRAKFNEMLDEYYQLRGWNKKGIPTKETFEKYGLLDEYKVMSSAIKESEHS